MDERRPTHTRNQGSAGPRDTRIGMVLLLGLLLVVPPTVFRLACLGNTCDAQAASGPATLPFCSLPATTRDLIAAGFRDGRSPEVLGVAGDVPIADAPGGHGRATTTPWPSTTSDVRVPIVFFGSGVRSGSIPDESGLAQIAPTIAEIIGFRPPFPDVRSGRAVAGVASGSPPRLVVEVALEGLGTGELEAAPTAWPTLRRMLEEGAGTTLGTVGSLPLDPAAALTTIGTGGLPSEHGITGRLLRNETGALTSAWGAEAPLPVISTLAEDLDGSMGELPVIGLVAPGRADRGIIGGAWYPEHDRDLVARTSTPPKVARIAGAILERGFGRDGVPDLLAVVLRGDIAEMDASLGRLLSHAERVSGGSVAFVVAGTGSSTAGGSLHPASLGQAAEEVAGPVVEAVVPGGIYLDLPALLSGGIPREVVRGALAGARGTDGTPLLVDAFHSYAVSLARYC